MHVLAVPDEFVSPVCTDITVFTQDPNHVISTFPDISRATCLSAKL